MGFVSSPVSNHVSSLVTSAASGTYSCSAPDEFTVHRLLIPLHGSLSVVIFISSMVFHAVSVVTSLLEAEGCGALADDDVPRFPSFDLFFRLLPLASGRVFRFGNYYPRFRFG